MSDQASLATLTIDSLKKIYPKKTNLELASMYTQIFFGVSATCRDLNLSHENLEKVIFKVLTVTTLLPELEKPVEPSKPTPNKPKGKGHLKLVK